MTSKRRNLLRRIVMCLLGIKLPSDLREKLWKLQLAFVLQWIEHHVRIFQLVRVNLKKEYL